ncbi:metalloregulator ArsR/SmtB family transcription factor [Shigella flexneri]
MSFLLPIQLFKILADMTNPSGHRFTAQRTGRLCVCNLCTALDQSQPKEVSHHLALLRESGLLLDRKQGKWVHYRLSPHIPAWAAKIIDEPGDVNRKRFRQLPQPGSTKLFRGQLREHCS